MQIYTFKNYILHLIVVIEFKDSAIWQLLYTKKVITEKCRRKV